MRGAKGKKSEGKKILSTGSSEAEEKDDVLWVRASTVRRRRRTDGGEFWRRCQGEEDRDREEPHGIDM
jgi:hypothetical protein